MKIEHKRIYGTLDGTSEQRFNFLRDWVRHGYSTERLELFMKNGNVYEHPSEISIQMAFDRLTKRKVKKEAHP